MCKRTFVTVTGPRVSLVRRAPGLGPPIYGRPRSRSLHIASRFSRTPSFLIYCNFFLLVRFSLPLNSRQFQPLLREISGMVNRKIAAARTVRPGASVSERGQKHPRLCHGVTTPSLVGHTLPHSYHTPFNIPSTMPPTSQSNPPVGLYFFLFLWTPTTYPLQRFHLWSCHVHRSSLPTLRCHRDY